MDDYDEGEHVKETFAYFGRAYYMANVFEAGLAIAIMQLDFLAEIKKQFLANDRKNFDRAEYEAKFDAFMDKQHAQTLGNLIKNAKQFTSIPPDFHTDLSDVKAQRDFIAHHFFRERSVEFASRRGKDSMIEELQSAHDLFTRVDRKLDSIMEPLRRKLGFNDEMIQAMEEKFMQEARDMDSP